MVHRVEPLLRLPRVAGDDRGLSALAEQERRANLRMQAIRPRGLHQDVAAVRVPGLRDRSASFALPTGVFAQDEAEVRHELTRRREASPIHQLRGQHHRPVNLQAAEALERRVDRRVRGRQREGRDLLIQDVPTREFVFEEREVLAEDQPILGRKRRRRARELTQPRVVRGALPESPPVEEPAAREELENVVARLDHFSLQRLATPHDIADALLHLAGNPDRRE